MNRSEYAANLSLQQALQVQPVRASVRALYTIKEIRRKQRERRARLAVYVLVPLTMLSVLLAATSGS